MIKHISDSEKLVIAALNRRETELKQQRELNEQLMQQLKAMKHYIGELKASNKLLSNQIHNLVYNKVIND